MVVTNRYQVETYGSNGKRFNEPIVYKVHESYLEPFEITKSKFFSDYSKEEQLLILEYFKKHYDYYYTRCLNFTDPKTLLLML